MVTQTWSGAQLLFSRHLAAGDVEETAEKQQRRIEASISDRSFGRRCSARELRWAAALVSLRFESMMMISCRRVEAAHSGANKPERNEPRAAAADGSPPEAAWRGESANLAPKQVRRIDRPAAAAIKSGCSSLVPFIQSRLLSVRPSVRLSVCLSVRLPGGRLLAVARARLLANIIIARIVMQRAFLAARKQEIE